MFPVDVAEAFEREQGCTEREWLANLPGAVGEHGLRIDGDSALVAIGSGRLRLHWQVLPERRIALARLPRLLVHYRFEQLDAAARRDFMRRFDLFLQRGGG